MSARKQQGNGGGDAPTPAAEASETLLRLASQMAHDAETLSRWARRLLTEPDQTGRILMGMRKYANDPGRCLPDAVGNVVPVVDRALPESKRKINARSRAMKKATKAVHRSLKAEYEAVHNMPGCGPDYVEASNALHKKERAEARRIVRGENVVPFGGRQ